MVDPSDLIVARHTRLGGAKVRAFHCDVFDRFKPHRARALVLGSHFGCCALVGAGQRLMGYQSRKKTFWPFSVCRILIWLIVWWHLVPWLILWFILQIGAGAK